MAKLKKKEVDVVSEEVALGAGMSRQEWALVLQGLGRAPNQAEFAIFLMSWSEVVCGKSSSQLLGSVAPARSGESLSGGSIELSAGRHLVVATAEQNLFSNLVPEMAAETLLSDALDSLLLMGAKPSFFASCINLGDSEKLTCHRKLRYISSGLSRAANMFGVPSLPSKLTFNTKFERGSLLAATAFGVVDSNHLVESSLVEGEQVLVYCGLPTGFDGLSTHAPSGSPRKSKIPVVDIFFQKRQIDTVVRAVEQELISSFVIPKRGGLSSSLVDLATKAQTGLEISIDKVPVFSEAMGFLDILLSQTPHRILALVPKAKHREVSDLFSEAGLTLSTLGKNLKTDSLSLLWHHKELGDVPYQFIKNNIQVRDHGLVKNPPMLKLLGAAEVDEEFDSVPMPKFFPDLWVDMLANPNLGSRERFTSQFDTDVGANTLVRDSSLASLLRIPSGDSKEPLALGCALVSMAQYVGMDPYLSAAHAFTNALGKLACVGVKPVACSCSFSGGDPKSFKDISEVAELVRSVSDFASENQLPFLSGEMSVFNGSSGKPVPATAVVGVFGESSNTEVVCNSWFKNSGDKILLIGRTLNQPGGSEYLRHYHKSSAGRIPEVDIEVVRKTAELVSGLVADALVNSAYALEEGGILLGLTRSSVAGDSLFGAKLEFSLSDQDLEDRGFTMQSEFRMDYFLLSEIPGRFLLSCSESNLPEVKKRVLDLGLDIEAEGSVGGKSLEILGDRFESCKVPVKTVSSIWSKSLDFMWKE